MAGRSGRDWALGDAVYMQSKYMSWHFLEGTGRS